MSTNTATSSWVATIACITVIALAAIAPQMANARSVPVDEVGDAIEIYLGKFGKQIKCIYGCAAYIAISKGHMGTLLVLVLPKEHMVGSAV